MSHYFFHLPLNKDYQIIFKNLFSILYLAIFVSGIVGQTIDTLIIQSEITDLYKNYLTNKETGWNAQINCVEDPNCFEVQRR